MLARTSTTRRSTMTVSIAVAQARSDTKAYEPFDGLNTVLAGDPAARVAWLRTDSGGQGVLYTGMFTAQPSTFRYSFSRDQSFRLLARDLAIPVHRRPP